MQRPDEVAPEGEPVPRRAARVLLRDRAGRVLLLRYDAGGYVFWAAPGGAVEDGETDAEAATRELWEEVRVRAELRGPVHVAVGRFHHEGRYVENTDVFFAGSVEGSSETPVFAVNAFEAECLREARWWTVEELEGTSERVFPVGVVAVLRSWDI